MVHLLLFLLETCISETQGVIKLLVIPFGLLLDYILKGQAQLLNTLLLGYQMLRGAYVGPATASRLSIPLPRFTQVLGTELLVRDLV